MIQDTTLEPSSEDKSKPGSAAEITRVAEEVRDCLEVSFVFPEGIDAGAATEQYIKMLHPLIIEQVAKDGVMVLFNFARRLPAPVVMEL